MEEHKKREGTEDDWEKNFVPGIEVNQFVDFMRILCQPMEPKTRGKLKSPTIPNMAELHQAGVKFNYKRLVSSSKDVELVVVEHGIVQNWIGENSGVSTLLNNLDSGVIVSDYCYATLCDELNNYCRTRRHKWMANLRQNYFNTPWSTVSVIAASVLLILTKQYALSYLLFKLQPPLVSPLYSPYR
ncbi:hypothetical protein L3X38_007818 [Prunus dulcis]|uniref:Uncharacterized protein n=1 Tax=Prunus dulcis TaxID=3755 RepID=A0AAD4ZV88_PRUDU|nr:hypothetical protein L3X38_007818 [Prunus dulcis]